MRNIKDIRVKDRTDRDANFIIDTVIIHDTVGDEPSIIAYDLDIDEAIRELVGTLPEDYEHLPRECTDFWNFGNDPITLDGYQAALGIRIELFEDFIRENTGDWAVDGTECTEEPVWVYPDDVLPETPKK